MKHLYTHKVLISLSFLTVLAISCLTHKRSIDFTQEGGFTEGIEGPATDHLGNVYAVNYKEQGTIGQVTPSGLSSVFVTLPDGSIGNGIRFGSNKNMYVADYTNHNILEVDMKSKKVSVFAHEPSANQPNDIAIAPNQTLYASDPNWSNDTGNLWKVTKEKGFELLEKNMGTTNGIEVSPDGLQLYVNESVQRKIWVYDILEDGMTANKRELIAFDDHGLDGMRSDNQGNLYVCRYGKGTIVIISPSGSVLGEIQLIGKKPSNITFSNDFKKCYITMADRGCIESVDL